jgi:DNA-binding transcriptional LysR family regulator
MSDISDDKIRRLDGSLLLVFVELVRHRRTTVVAERLGLTQSAVSHALARLRDLFSDPLFVRRATGLSPTQHALELAPKLEEILRLTRDSLGLAERFDPRTSERHFRLGAPDYLCSLISPALLGRFEQAAPRARFSFRLALGNEALAALERDDIDVALGRFREPLPQYRVQRLFEEQYCVVARKGHPRVRRALDLTTYAGLGHVLTSVAGDFTGFNDPALRRLRIDRRVVASVPRFLIALAVVAESDAIATVPRQLALRHARGMKLQVLPPPFELEPFDVVAVSRQRTDPAVDWLTEQLRAVGGAESGVSR